MGHAPPPFFGGSVISIPTRMGKLCHQINAASPSRCFDLPLPLERDLAKKKKAVGCLSSKKYSNHNYTHTLESSCLCQVAEINVALRGERAARACKGAKEFLTRANDKSFLHENMKHIRLFMLDRFENLLLQDDLINYVCAFKL